MRNCQAQAYKGGQLDYAVFLSWIPMPLEDETLFKDSSKEIKRLLQADPRLRIVDDIKGKDSLLDLVLLSKPSDSISLKQLKERLYRSQSLASLFQPVDAPRAAVAQRVLDSRVEQVLKKLGLLEYAGVFAKEKINLEALLLLDEADLKEIGILEMGPRKHILHKIAQIKSSEVNS